MSAYDPLQTWNGSSRVQFMRAVPHQIAVMVVLLASACGQPAVKASESLVGAQALPSVDNLSREIIHIYRGFGQVSEGSLSYELKPDNTLVVAHQNRQADKVIAAETFRLSPEVAAQARSMLWRLRPATLEGQGLTRHETRPVGCDRQGPHDFGEVAVAFINEGETGIDDDRVGMFELPFPDSCNTRQASEARNLVKRVLRSFPASRIAADFLKSS